MYEPYAAVLLVIIIAALFFRRNGKKVFIIRIRPARIRVIKGSVPKKLIQDCLRIIQNQRVYGDVWATWDKDRNELRIHFSKTLDETFRQRFRNLYSLASWRYVPNRKSPTGPKRTG